MVLCGNARSFCLDPWFVWSVSKSNFVGLVDCIRDRNDRPLAPLESSICPFLLGCGESVEVAASPLAELCVDTGLHDVMGAALRMNSDLHSS